MKRAQVALTAIAFLLSIASGNINAALAWGVVLSYAIPAALQK